MITAWKAVVLPLHHCRKSPVGAAGFEPTTSRTQTERSSKLSYAPVNLATGSILSGLVAVNPLGAIKKIQLDDESGDHWTWIVIHWEHSDGSNQKALAGRRVRRLLDVDCHPHGAFQ